MHSGMVGDKSDGGKACVCVVLNDTDIVNHFVSVFILVSNFSFHYVGHRRSRFRGISFLVSGLSLCVLILTSYFVSFICTLSQLDDQ